VVEDRGDVARHVGDAAPFPAGRARVAGPRVGDQLPALGIDSREQLRELGGRVRRAAVEHQRYGIRRAVAQYLDVPPVDGDRLTGH
jgi:hypothetical protein